MKKDEIKVELIDSIWNLMYSGVSDKKIIEKYEKRILAIKDAYLSCEFARLVKGADIKAHSQVILDSKDPKYNYLFAKKVRGVDTKAHVKCYL